jgi:hypothetical protein
MGSLMLGLFISLIGMAAFVYGKKTSRLVPLIGGLILMIYPYFVPNVLAMGVIATGVVIGIILFRDALE